MNPTLIQLQDVTFTAQEKTIVQNLSLDIGEGETVALVGPSGSGKSSVLKIAAGLIVPTEGKALFRGHDINTMGRSRNLAFRREAAFVFQDSALWANQTIEQILELPLKLHFPDMPSYQRKMHMVEVLAASGYRRAIDIRPSQLSMGEQKLIAFARAFMLDPTILFLDEWTESLDDVAARRLVDVVKSEKAQGRTIVFVSHNFAVIRELATRICMIVDGRLSLDLQASELREDESLARMIEKGIAL
jgi:ABC-type multidrug transport system ATPase subunit